MIAFKQSFKEISTQAEVLCDPKKRNLYDPYGKDGLTEAGEAVVEVILLTTSFDLILAEAERVLIVKDPQKVKTLCIVL